MPEITITLPDGSERKVEAGTTAGELATQIGRGLAKAAVIAVIDDVERDLVTPLHDGARVGIITEDSERGLYTIRHSTAHVLAQAVLDLFPGATFGIGPPVENGFYYDFELPDGGTFTPDDLDRIDARMREIIKEKQPFIRDEIPSEQARVVFKDHKYKLEIIDGQADDPTSVTIPASVFLNGGSAAIQVATRVVPNTRTVTITATSGGQARSATLTLQPPTIATVAANPTSTISPSTVPVTVTLTAPLPSATTATVACTGQGLTCPTSVSLSGSTASFNVTTSDVPTARTGTITVTFNGVATSGTLDIQPLAVESMIVSPATIRAGVSSSFTMQLNRASTSGLTFSFASSDPTVVFAPAAVTFTAGQITKLVTINSAAPQSVSKTVTITATANRSTPFGTSVITKTATIAVNP